MVEMEDNENDMNPMQLSYLWIGRNFRHRVNFDYIVDC